MPLPTKPCLLSPGQAVKTTDFIPRPLRSLVRALHRDKHAQVSTEATLATVGRDGRSKATLVKFLVTQGSYGGGRCK